VRDDPLRLKDILTAIEAVQRYVTQGRSHFLQDELVQVWVIHHLQLIGEAGRNLSDECRAGMPAVPWPRLVGMRNALVHQYFRVVWETVWDTAVTDLPYLKEQITQYIEREGIVLPQAPETPAP